MAGVPLTHERKGTVLKGVQTWDLDQYALLDKIINVKFIRRSGQSFVVRSDYEVALSKDGQPYFVPIKQKPAIHINYTQAAQSTAIQVFIRITNLFFNITHIDNDIFTDAGDPIIQADIQMGYRNQFPDWTKPPLSFDTKDSQDSLSKTNRLRMFYEMSGFQETNTLTMLDTGLLLSVQILAVYNETLPPDRVTVFQGIVGTMDYGFRWNSRGEIAEYFATKSNFPESDDGDELTFIEKVFWFYITSRFIRRGVTHRFYSSDADRLGNNPFDVSSSSNITRVDILDYDTSTTPRRFFSPEEQLDKSLEGEDGRWVSLNISKTGILQIEDAAVLGVVVHTTERVRELSRNLYTPQTIPGGQGEDVVYTERTFPFIQAQEHEGAQMYHIQKHFPDIRWFVMSNGDYFVYHVDEHIAEIREESNERGLRHTRPLLLPAVYDISISGVRTIRCPFISFLSPGQDVGFSSRYTISDLVGFYYPLGKDAWFTVILSNIEFSTVDDANMMTLMCVDTKEPVTTKTAVDDVAEDGIAEDEIKEKRAEVVERVVRWKKQSIGQWLSRNTNLSYKKKKADDITMWSDFADIAVLFNPLFDLVEDVPRSTGKGNEWKDRVKAINWLLDTDTGEGETNRDISIKLIKNGRDLATGWQDLERWGVVGAHQIAQLNEYEDIWYIPYIAG